VAPRRVRGGRAGGPPLTFGLDVTLPGRHPGWDSALGRRFGDDADGPPATHAPERHYPADQGEQSVIPAAAHAGPGMEMSAALADQDLARVDPLAAEALHAQSLSRGVTPVAAGRRALLVCHRQLFCPAAAPAFGAALPFAALVFPAPAAFAGPAFAALGFAAVGFAVLAFAGPALAGPPFPVAIPVILTWVYRWRWPS